MFSFLYIVDKACDWLKILNLNQNLFRKESVSYVILLKHVLHSLIHPQYERLKIMLLGKQDAAEQ